MDIVFKNDGEYQYIKSKKINYFLGANRAGKTYILTLLKEGFLGHNQNFTVDGLNINNSDYNVIYFDDVTDFSNEFKFTKNNNFRKLIYDNILNKLDTDNLLEKVNKLFDQVDEKVNEYLDLKINKEDNNIKFDIEINDINDIVNKFTNIYIDNYILNKDNLPRSTKRKLIYQLLLLELNNSSKTNIVIIDNFDLYLDYKNTVSVIKLIEKYAETNENTYFYLSTHNNIYELIKDKETIYHITNNKIKKINDLKKIIEEALMKEDYLSKKNKYKIFENYKAENSLLYIEEIDKLYSKIMNNHQYNIGKIYVNDNIEIEEIINYENLFYYYFFKNINEILNFC